MLTTGDVVIQQCADHATVHIKDLNLGVSIFSDREGNRRGRIERIGIVLMEHGLGGSRDTRFICRDDLRGPEDHLTGGDVDRLRVARAIIVVIVPLRYVLTLGIARAAEILVWFNSRPDIDGLIRCDFDKGHIPRVDAVSGAPSGPAELPRAALGTARINCAVISPEQMVVLIEPDPDSVGFLREFRSVMRVALSVSGGPQAYSGKLGYFVDRDERDIKMILDRVRRVAVD